MSSPTYVDGSVGENMAWSSESSYGGKAATDSWYSEYTDPLKSAGIPCATPSDIPGRCSRDYDFDADGDTDGMPTGNDGTGHFTQVVWKATTKIGCGVKHDGNIGPNGYKTVWVCQCVHSQPTRACARLISPHHSRAPCLRRLAGTSWQATGDSTMHAHSATRCASRRTC